MRDFPSIILASGSPRRRELLQAAGIPFKVLIRNTDESFPEFLEPEEVAIYIARNKAQAVAGAATGNIILAADTIVVVDGQILGKPLDRKDAIKMLKLLSGRSHKVITGVSIIHNNTDNAFAETTEVIFKILSDEQIEYYVDEFKPFDKAGAYAIQEWIGMIGIEKINGDYYNVMGLPISRIFDTLNKII